MTTSELLTAPAPPANDLATAVNEIAWDFATAPRAGGVHSMHGYPAKFIPEVPRALIDLMSRPGERILDPFCGGGTTGVEALAAGRSYVGLDANAFAVLLSKVKVQHLCDGAVAELQRHARMLEHAGISDQPGAWRPTIPNIEKWYDPRIFDDLASLRDLVTGLPIASARDLALLAFASTAGKLSFQESETRYVSRPRTHAADAVCSSYLRDLARMLAVASRNQSSSHWSISLGDARVSDSYSGTATGEISAVITSPPYPNAYDYHLYHRFRLFWLGDGPQSLRQAEIGSHLKNQSSSTPTDDYLRDMGSMFANVRRVLRPGGHFALVVGDGIHKGETFATARELAQVAQHAGYSKVACVSRNLPTTRRSVTHAGRRLQDEQILILRAED